MKRSIPVYLITSLVLLTTLASAFAQRPDRRRPNIRRAPDRLSTGDAAPDFTLKLMDGKDDETVTLSQFKGDRPVALIFGSYT